MKVFFCGFYSLWQRDTNKNDNSLLIQFFPNDTAFDIFSDEQLQAVFDLINDSPRKRLEFRFLAELLSNFL